MEKKRNIQWKDIPPRQRKGIAIKGFIQIVLTAIALWDLSQRPASEVNGKKWVWVLVSFVQPVGPISYLLFGRNTIGPGTHFKKEPA